MKENKKTRATSDDFKKLLRLAKKEDIETDEQVLNIINALADVGLINDENKDAAMDLYYYYSLRMRKAERYKEVAQHEHDFWAERDGSSIQDLSSQIKRHADMVSDASQTAGVAGDIVAILKKEKIFEDKSHKQPFKKKSSYENRLIIAVVEDEMTGETKEKKVRIPMQVLQQADKETSHLPAAMQGEAFDRYVMNYLEEMMQEFELLDWTEVLIDYRPGDPADSFDTNPKPKPFMKDDEFDMLDEAKEDDIKDKYDLQDSGPQPYNGDPYPHFSYNEMTKWVNRNRPKRIKFLDWMAKQIAGSGWKDTDAMETTWKILPAVANFLKFQDQFKEKNINKYPSLEALQAAYKADVLDKIVAKARKGRAKPSEEHGDVVYEDDRFFVVQPKTTKASCYYGAKTKWCISQKDNKHFSEYVDAGKVFYFIRDDTKKNADDFYSLAVQYNKYTGQREKLWDRRDHAYGPDDWPVDAYGEESEEPIMDSIQKHFDDNYKGVERTLETLNNEINNEQFDKNENVSDFLTYDLIFESRVWPVGDQQQIRMQAEYYIYYTPSPSIKVQMEKSGWRNNKFDSTDLDQMINLFDKRKKQIIKMAFEQFPIQDIDIEFLPDHNQINLTAKRLHSAMDVGQAHAWIMADANSAEEDVMDFLDAFERGWSHHFIEYIENTSKRPSIDENKKRIKVRIK